MNTIKELRKKARELGIKSISIRIKKYKCKNFNKIDGAYFENQTINITTKHKKYNKTAVAITLAHEIGHHISYNSSKQKAISKAYEKLRDKKRLTDRQAQLIHKEEYKAWLAGEMILKEIGFQKWDKFFDDKNKCLETYENIY